MKNYLIFIVIYLIVINVFAMIITIVDKLRAIHHGWRVKESALLAISAFGGSPVMLLTMLVIRHKTRKPKFMVGIPLILLLQVAAAVVLWKVFYA